MEILREQYEKEIIPSMMKKFNYKSVMEVPKLDKGDVKAPDIKDTVHVNGTDIELESKQSFTNKIKKMFE